VKATKPSGELALQLERLVKEVRRPARSRASLRAAVSEIPLLRDVPPEYLDLILQQIRDRPVEKGEAVFAQGEAGDSLVFVVSGELAVRAVDDTGAEVEMATLVAGDVAGEISFLSGVPRTATLVAKGKGEVLELPRGAIEPVVRKHPDLAEALLKLYRERVLDGVLARSRLFRSLPRTARERVAGQLVPISVEAGQPIVTEGTPGATLYILQRGEVRVATARSKRGKDVQLAVLRPHEVFGDLALILGTARTASVTAQTDAELLCLEKKDLESLLAHNPKVRAELIDIQLERFVSTAQILGRK